MKEIETDVFILGGGWSGLAAADHLLRKKMDVVILEKEAEVGGLAKTLHHGGFKFDIGGHRLYFKQEKNNEYIKNLLHRNELLLLKRKSKIFLDGQYISYPLIFPSIFKISKKYLFKILLEILQLKNQAEFDNCEIWLKSNYGETLYKIFFKDYTEKVWGKTCDRLSSVWTEKRIGRQRLFEFLKDNFVDNCSHKERTQSFYYPRQGIGSLVKALEHKIVPQCRIYYNARLKKFKIGRKKLDSLTFLSNGEEVKISFKYILSSIPLKELLQPFLINQNSKLHDRVSEIQYRSLILACVIIDKEIISDWHWCYFPSKDILFSRVHEPKLWSKDLALPGQSLLCMEIFCDTGDELWRMPDDEIIEQVKKSLKNTALLNNGDFLRDAALKR